MNLSEYLSQHKKKVLIFDLDATILLLHLPWHQFVDPIEDKLRNIDPVLIEEYRKKKFSLSVLQNKYVEKDPSLANFFRNYNQSFECQLTRYDTNAELVSFIRNNSEYELHVWSSNSRPTIEKVLHQEGIETKFSSLVTRSDVDFIKPHKEGFSHILKASYVLTDYLFIGDSKADKEAALSADIDFLEENYFRLIA